MRYKKEEVQLYKRTMPSGESVYYYRVYSPEGKRIRLSTEKAKKHEARTYVNQLIAEGNLIPDKKKNMTFKEFTKDFYIWDKCQYGPQKRPSTMRLRRKENGIMIKQGNEVLVKGIELQEFCKMNAVDDYIGSKPGEIRPILEKVREIIFQTVPEAEESISYGIPAYKLNGKPLVYFAAQKKHLGFYATPSGHEAFTKKLSAYKQGKGSVQFPFNQTIPYDLIREIVQYRSEEEK